MEISKLTLRELRELQKSITVELYARFGLISHDLKADFIRINKELKQLSIKLNADKLSN